MIAVVVLSPLAEDDLVEIWCTVAADDIRAADNLVDELHQVTRLLVLQPMIGRLRPEMRSDLRNSAAALQQGRRYCRLLSRIARNSLSARQFGHRDEFTMPSPTS